MIVWPAKDPAEVLDYTWTVGLDTGDTIASYTATTTSGVTIDSDSENDTQVTLWLSGGVDGETAMFNLTATTAGGRTFREIAVLPVFDRASELLAMFRLRYPALASVEDGQVGYWLADALNLVGTSWGDSQDVGRLAFAAHQVAGSVSGAIPAGVTSFKSGTFSATVAESIAALKGFESTVYGRELLALRRTLFAGPMLAWTPPAADYYA